MSQPESCHAIAADLRAGSIDSGAALMIAEVVLEALAELPGGRDLIAAAVARKAAQLSAGPGHPGDSRASLMVMHEIVRDAVEPVRAAA